MTPPTPLLLDHYVDRADAAIASHLIVDALPGDTFAAARARFYGSHRTLLTYECRTRTTDDDSRHLFDRYWWLIRPFVQHIMNATVRTIAASAEAGMPVDDGAA